jgi:hypothetical protein
MGKMLPAKLLQEFHCGMGSTWGKVTFPVSTLRLFSGAKMYIFTAAL